MIARLCGLLAAAGITLAAAACGGDPPGQAAPVLRDRLSAVDDDLSHHDYAAARRDLASLSQLVDEARSTGRIGADQAHRIDTAVSRLSADLTTPTRSRPTATAPSGTPTRDRPSDHPGTGPGPGSGSGPGHRRHGHHHGGDGGDG